MIHIHVEWPETPSLLKDIDDDIQPTSFLYGSSYVLSYMLLACTLWLLFL
ncbi:MAG TPA: hypothetical protein VF209_01060 [Patescibacteria group bacterium]